MIDNALNYHGILVHRVDTCIRGKAVGKPTQSSSALTLQLRNRGGANMKASMHTGRISAWP
jgi:hypothetical protein